MTSPLDTLLQSGSQADGAHQIFDRLVQLESAPAQILDARSYEVDDRLLNTEPMFGQGGVNASGLTRIDGGLPYGVLAALDTQLARRGKWPGSTPVSLPMPNEAGVAAGRIAS